MNDWGGVPWNGAAWEGIDWVLGPLIIIVALVVSVWAGGRLTLFILSRASHSPDSSEGPGHDDPNDSLPIQVPLEETTAEVIADGHTAVLTGGRWIGHLERFSVTLAIIAGYPAALAVIVAIKGLGRFAEIRKSTDASEKFVIGTLASMLISSIVALLALWALSGL